MPNITKQGTKRERKGGRREGRKVATYRRARRSKAVLLSL